MQNNIKILENKKLYEGFNRLYEYEIQVPSFAAEKEYNEPIKREIMHCSDAVFILIYAPEIDSFVLCQEFRAGVFFNQSQDDPFILECVAGMIDRDATPEEIAKAEVFEETGLKVDKIKPIAIAYSSPGRITEKTYLYYAEVSGTPRSGIHGLVSEHEEITTHIIKRVDAYKLMDEFKIVDTMTLLALNWFRC